MKLNTFSNQSLHCSPGTLPVGFVVTPISFVDVAICVLESAPTMGLVIGPLACVHAFGGSHTMHAAAVIL